MHRHIGAIVALLLAVSALVAQETPGTKAVAAEGPKVEVEFSDGSLVKLSLLDDKLDVVTRYGRLQVPLAEVRRIELGVRYPEGALQKIEDAIRRLNDPDFKKREAASAELLAFRELAYPHVRRAAATATSAEASKRARALLEELKNRVPEEKLTLKELDTITTIDFPIAGRIEATSLKARSPLLGDVEVRLVQVRSIRWKGSSTDMALTIDAAKYGLPQGTWMDTGVDLDGGPFSVQATGTVDVMPQNPGQFMASPDGLNVNIGNRNGQSGVGPPGALIGKIGERGQPFLVGSRFESSKGEGRLYLRLESSPWRMPMTGSFHVKVAVGR